MGLDLVVFGVFVAPKIPQRHIQWQCLPPNQGHDGPSYFRVSRGVHVDVDDGVEVANAPQRDADLKCQF